MKKDGVQLWPIYLLAAGVVVSSCADTGPDPNAPVVAIVEPSVDTAVTLGDPTTFRATISDPAARIAGDRWTFGDGTQLTHPGPHTHTFAGEGLFETVYSVLDEGDDVIGADTVFVAVVPPGGTANFALRFFGNGVNDIDRVKILIDDGDENAATPGPPADIGATDFTIEFWMRALESDNGAPEVQCGNNFAWVNGNIIVDRDRFGLDRKYGISMAGGRIVFGVSGDGTGDRTICGTSRVDDGEWHHIAVTRARSSGALQLFVDGDREASIGSGPGGDVSYPDQSVCGNPCPNSNQFLVLGAEKHDVDPVGAPSFNGSFDELRLSTTIRYTDDFTPPTSRFVPDGATAALYHFDEGAGTTVGDASGASGGPSDGTLRVGGNPEGPQWVVSTAPTG